MRPVVLVLYGGRSSEHEVSCLSARSVLGALDRDRWEVVQVGITRTGRWTLTEGDIVAAPGRGLPEVSEQGRTVGLIGTRHGPRLLRHDDERGTASVMAEVDVAFPVLHGPFGEDGAVQGLFESVGLPYVGADVTASSIGIDKSAMKAAFSAAGLPQGAYRVVRRVEWDQDPEVARARLADLPLPWFCKPARQGSSIGIRKVSEPDQLEEALREAFYYDEVAVVEQGLASPRELEVGVLGRDELAVTAAGEIRPSHDFYDFEAKYLDDSELVVPARLPDHIADTLDGLARRAYQAIGCRGMARVDFFLADGKLLVNEINTIPGFTPNSMFPRLWDAQGLTYPKLIDRLLELALDGERPSGPP